jgi:hypothetical protein
MKGGAQSLEHPKSRKPFSVCEKQIILGKSVMKKFLQIPVFLLLACGGLSSPSFSAETLASGTCDARAASGLNVTVFVPLGEQPQIELLDAFEGQLDILSNLGGLKGSRILENGTVKLSHFLTYVGAFEQIGNHVLSLKVDGIVVDKRELTLLSDGCHVIGQSIAFTVQPKTPIVLDPSQDYYPLDGGQILAVDGKDGSAKLLGTTKSWTAIEIIREVSLETHDKGVVSISWDLEKKSQYPTSIGSFYEKGFDRGPLINPVSQDTGRREIFGN